MGHSYIGIITDPLEGTLLVAEGEARKGGAYIARITGPDPTYKYQREFLSVKENLRNGRVRAKVPIAQLVSPYDILEIRAGGSWKNDYRNFYLYHAKDRKLEFIDETTLRQKLAEKLSKRGGDKSEKDSR